MRIVQVVTRLQWRGAEVFATQLSDELALRGHRVLVVGLYPSPADPLTPARARVVTLGGRRRRGVSPALLRGVAELLAHDPPDLVQANGSDTLAYASLARRRLGAAWPLVYRNIGMPGAWTRRAGRRLWVRAMLRGVERVASVSEASAREFARSYRFSPARIVTIPRGVPCPPLGPREARRATLAKAVGAPGTAPLLVHVGSFTPEKNHAGLLEAFRRIAERRPEARLALIGEGPLAASVGEAAAGAGLAGRVHLLGARADAAEMAGGADVFLLPSLTEGLPGVVLEAAAREVPAVAYDVGGVAEAIREGETGFVVPAGDTGAFADRVLRLVEDPSLARRMGEAARAHACGAFRLSRVVDSFERLYGDLVPCPAGSASSS